MYELVKKLLGYSYLNLTCKITIFFLHYPKITQSKKAKINNKILKFAPKRTLYSFY